MGLYIHPCLYESINVCKYVYIHILHLYVKSWKLRMFYWVSMRMGLSVLYSVFVARTLGEFWGREYGLYSLSFMSQNGQNSGCSWLFLTYLVWSYYLWIQNERFLRVVFYIFIYFFIWILNFYNEEYMINLALNLPGFLCLKYVSSKQQNPVWQSSLTWSA